MIIEITMLLSSSFDVLAHYYQWKAIETKKSVYGLSFDFFILSLVEYLTSSIYLVFYLGSDRIQYLYKKRSPIYAEIPLSKGVFISDVLKLIICIGLVYQLYKYFQTKREEQSFSGSAKALLTLNLLVIILIVYWSYYGLHTINSLDILEYLWIINQQMRLFKYFPQVTMNWVIFGNFQSSKFLKFQIYALILLLLAKLLVYSKLEWHEIPFNYITLPNLIISLGCIILMIHQKGLYQKSVHRIL